MSDNNSISKLLEQFIQLYNNSLATYEKTNEAITSDAKVVNIDLFDPTTGITKTIPVASFGYLKKELERLSNNVETLSGSNEAASSVRLPDGTFRKVYTSKLKGPAPTITSISAPSAFETRANEFFEDFLNPLLKVKFDLTGQIPVNTEQVYIERYVFKADDLVSTTAFDTLYKNNSEIDYTTFKTELSNNSYKYVIDKQVVNMPVRSVQYYGSFDVVSIDNAQKTAIVDGVSQTKTVRLFTVNKLTYTDSTKTLGGTEVLKKGDSLVVNSGKFSTRYKIDAIDSDTLQIELSLVEGFEAIKLGDNQLSVYKDIDTGVALEVNVSFDERQVVFVKAVDADSKVQSELFSPGAGFYSNELVVLLDTGLSMTLAEYYKREVADFGQFIKSLKVDAIPPAAMGVMPNTPIIETGNFKVVQINKHLTDNDATNKIVKLKSEKAANEQNIKKIDNSISSTRSLVNTKKYSSKVEADKDKSQLNSLLSSRKAEAEAYSSVVTEIATIASSSNLNNVSPKYRIRGFWSIPEPKSLNDSKPQEIVQFKIRYRYNSTNGSTSQIEQINFNDTTNSTVKTAAFSNWIEVDGPVRKRVKDEITGKFYWKVENEEDAQAVNFNSLDVAISPGEIVEVMVKSVSEAGFPSNPIVSDWSPIISIPFPEGEIPVENLTDIVKENSLETIRVKIDNDLTALGVYSHIGESFTSGDKFFAHTANSIASGFLTAEQNPVTVYEKMIEMQNQIDRLTAKINGTLGELQVYIEDESGNITNVSNNTTVKLFAGHYTDEVNALSGIKKGAIITKVFKVKLANTKATTLELVSRLVGDFETPAHVSSNIPGRTLYGFGLGTAITSAIGTTNITSGTSSNVTLTVPNTTIAVGQFVHGYGIPAGTTVQSISGVTLVLTKAATKAASGTALSFVVAAGIIDPTIAGDSYYTNEAKYDWVPIQYQNAPASSLATPWFSQIPFQSSQMKGQFIYSRFKNVANDDSLYVTEPVDTGISYATAPSNYTGVSDYEYGTSYNYNLTFANGNPAEGTNRNYFDATVSPYTATTGTNDFIWSGAYNGLAPRTTALDSGTGTVGSSEYDNGLYLHKNHPILNQSLVGNQLSILDLHSAGIIAMPKAANRRVNMDFGSKQTPYKIVTWTNNANVTVSRSIKMSFDANDVYLLGGRSCGAFLFMAPLEQKSLLVDAKNKFGKSRVDTGASKALSIDMIFQYRMTDYYGDDNNVGKVGGILTTSLANITYSKKIGLDILDGEKNEFKFDVEVYAKYKAEGSSVTNITKAMLTNFNTSGGGGGGGYRRWLDREDLAAPSEFTFYTQQYIQ
jgi:hypothetical protein